ncbi:uncharacterized protein LOC132198282 [Neocloeon triangulifer]|uniref:uncharacterized protein LOC132198282 n=1 Tax=Neocloeon triangulifer TaxID=2078957 RepID=UPI00286EF0AA|nr:uncharacterized protein LOC132198282 [Neocloeon triangulifer]
MNIRWIVLSAAIIFTSLAMSQIKNKSTRKPVSTVSTTTQTPKMCAHYTKLKEQFFESSRSEQFYDDSNPLQLLFAPKKVADGRRFQYQGRIYFESSIKSNYKDALESCLVRKMELLSFENNMERTAKFWRKPFSYAAVVEKNAREENDLNKLGKVIEFKNQVYLFGDPQSPVTWSENWKTCCELGMKPLSLDLNPDGIYYGKFETTEEKFALSGVFWTSGTKSGCSGQYTACFHTNSTFGMEVLGNGGDGSCVLITRLDGYNWAARSDQCSSKYQLACQGGANFALVSQSSTNVRVETDKCDSPSCFQYETCEINNDTMVFTETGKKEIYDPLSYGSWTQACGMITLVSNYAVPWAEAKKICCALGMELVSIRSVEKLNCVQNVLIDAIISTSQLWTSGRKFTACPKASRWCSKIASDFVSPKLPWEENVNDIGNSCIYMNTIHNGYFLGDPKLNYGDCGEKKFFVSKLLRLLNGTIENFSFAMKSFTQCLAENFEIISNGNVIDEVKTFAMLEQLSSKIIEETAKIIAEDFVAPMDDETMASMLLRLGGRRLAVHTENKKLSSFQDRKIQDFDIVAGLKTRINVCKKKTSGRMKPTVAFDFFVCLAGENSDILLRQFTKLDIMNNSKLATDDVDENALEIKQRYPKIVQGTPSPNRCSTLYNTKRIRMNCAEALGGAYAYDLAKKIEMAGPLHGHFDRMYRFCEYHGAHLPYARNASEFEAVFGTMSQPAFTTNQFPIVWSPSFKENGEFKWCCAECPGKVTTVPYKVEGDADGPFLLVSKPGSKVNLKVVSVFNARSLNVSSPMIACIFDEGTRSNDCNITKIMDKLQEYGMNMWMNLRQMAVGLSIPGYQAPPSGMSSLYDQYAKLLWPDYTD